MATLKFHDFAHFLYHDLDSDYCNIIMAIAGAATAVFEVLAIENGGYRLRFTLHFMIACWLFSIFENHLAY